MSNESLAAIFHGAGKPLELRKVPLPQPRGAEVLVRVLGCTLCGSDLHTFDGRRKAPVPTILGHEIVGEIAAFGDAAKRCDVEGNELQEGDRVTWSIVASCGDCFFCRRDLPQKCLTAVKYGHLQLRPGKELSGGLAQHCLLAPGTAIVRLPTELPLSVACPASCATATVAAALAAAGEVRDRNVCLFGAGLLGLSAAAMLQTAGAQNIVCVDLSHERLARAKQFGATHCAVPDELPDVARSVTDNHGFDAVLELSGSPLAFETGLEKLGLGGTLIAVGAVFPTEPVAISPEQIVRRNLTIRGVHNYAPRNLQDAVAFLATYHQDFPFADIVTQWFALDACDAAFAAARDPSHIRVGIQPRAS